MHSGRRIISGGLVVAAVALGAVPDAAAGPRDHQSGFFLRLSLGLGGAASEVDNTGLAINQLKFSGLAGEGNFAVGAMVAPNLALHGTVWGWTITEPDLEINNADAGSVNNAGFTLSCVGAGVTYYLMPANVYFSGSVGLGVLSADYKTGAVTTSVESDPGVAMDLTVGKEWWVGNRWGLGAALGVSYHSIPDSDVDPNWKGPSVALRFSATYN